MGRNLLSPESPMPMWGQPPPAVQQPSCIGPQRRCPILCGLLAKGVDQLLISRHQKHSGWRRSLWYGWNMGVAITSWTLTLERYG